MFGLQVLYAFFPYNKINVDYSLSLCLFLKNTQTHAHTLLHRLEQLAEYYIGTTDGKKKEIELSSKSKILF